MRQDVILAFALIAQSQVAMAQDYTVEFDGDVFHLARDEQVLALKKSSNVPVHAPNEYILDGEDLDHWKKLFTVNVYDHLGQATARIFTNAIIEQVLKSDPNMHFAIAPTSTDDDVVVDFLQADVAHHGYEFDVQRYQKGGQPGEIVFYQYSLRLPAPLKPESLQMISDKRSGWDKIIAGKEVDFIPVSELPF